MNSEEPASPPPPSPDSPTPEIQRGRLGYLYKQYQFLETLVALTISALILMSLGLNLFLFKQMRLTRGQLANQRPASAALLDEFHNKREPEIHSFVTKLDGYAATNPDFRAILEKYRPYLWKYFPNSPGVTNASPAAK